MATACWVNVDWPKERRFANISENIFHKSETVLKSGRECNIFPHPAHIIPSPLPSFTACYCIYVERDWGTKLLIHGIYSIFSQYWNLILVAYQKNSELHFVIVPFYLLFEYYRGFLHYRETEILIHCICSIFSQHWNLILVVSQKKCPAFRCFISSVQILSRISSLMLQFRIHFFLSLMKW